jgi:hypothetical protein
LQSTPEGWQPEDWKSCIEELTNDPTVLTKAWAANTKLESRESKREDIPAEVFERIKNKGKKAKYSLTLVDGKDDITLLEGSIR